MLRKILTGIRAGIFIIDPVRFVIADVNPIAAEIAGLSREELIGKPWDQIGWRDISGGKAADLSYTHETGDAPNQELLIDRPDGKIVPVLKTVLTAEKQGKLLLYAVVFDISERKAIEHQLFIAQKLESLGPLAAGIAHEINTPTQYFNNNIHFIKEAFEHIFPMCGDFRRLLEAAKAGPVPKDIIEGVEAALDRHDLSYLEEEMPGAIAQTLEGLERISVIVRSVKQFAHPGAADMAAADLNEALRSTVIVSRNEWKYVAELKTDLDPGLPLVECVISEINQVVLNLIINAAHAIAEAIEVNPQGTWLITLSSRKNGPWAEISVSDTGLGIPPEVQPKIFDPFFTTKEVGKGTGQGLAIARRIVVEKHKGEIFFETSPGQGTTFTIRLPLDGRGSNRDVQ
ncbi:MAG: PAS domain S-box protein [Desulfovibrionaceae bacterium]|nr:PAS domain S-box protein [Desulfovibrionaceae bacterium]